MTLLFFKGIIKRLAVTSKGRPRWLFRLICIRTYQALLHKEITKFIHRNDIVLDVGARWFPYTRYQKCKAIYGIDIPSESDGYLGWDTEKLKILSNNENIIPIYANCESMPFLSNSFDKIIMVEVIEHVANDAHAVLELARVLKPTGKILITTPNSKVSGEKNPYHLSEYTLIGFKNLLCKQFNNVEVSSIFPNPELFIKQYLPENKSILKRAYWKFRYSIARKAKKGQDDGGYTLLGKCEEPNEVYYPSKASLNDNQSLLCCPVCRYPLGEYNNNTDIEQISCNGCGKSFPYFHGIPMLMNSLIVKE